MDDYELSEESSRVGGTAELDDLDDGTNGSPAEDGRYDVLGRGRRLQVIAISTEVIEGKTVTVYDVKVTR